MIYGTSVVLRGMTASDLDYLAGFSREPELVALTGGRTLQGSDGLCSDQTISSRTRRRWAIMTVDMELIGEIELDHILWSRHEAELAICIVRKEYWSRGLGTDAVRTLLHHAFEELGLTSIYLRVYSDNLRAIRAYEHCGFRKVGAIQLDDRHGQGQQVLLMIVDNRSRELPIQNQRAIAASQHEPAV